MKKFSFVFLFVFIISLTIPVISVFATTANPYCTSTTDTYRSDWKTYYSLVNDPQDYNTASEESVFISYGLTYDDNKIRADNSPQSTVNRVIGMGPGLVNAGDEILASITDGTLAEDVSGLSAGFEDKFSKLWKDSEIFFGDDGSLHLDETATKEYEDYLDEMETSKELELKDTSLSGDPDFAKDDANTPASVPIYAGVVMGGINSLTTPSATNSTWSGCSMVILGSYTNTCAYDVNVTVTGAVSHVQLLTGTNTVSANPANRYMVGVISTDVLNSYQGANLYMLEEYASLNGSVTVAGGGYWSADHSVPLQITDIEPVVPAGKTLDDTVPVGQRSLDLRKKSIDSAPFTSVSNATKDSTGATVTKPIVITPTKSTTTGLVSPVIAVDTTKTTTPSDPTTTDPTTTPTTDDTPIDFTPIELPFKTKFPFCIPFDLINSVQSFKATPVAPKFNIVFPNLTIGGIKMTGGSFVLDLSVLDNVVPELRFFILISFLVGLIKLTRGIIRG